MLVEFKKNGKQKRMNPKVAAHLIKKGYVKAVVDTKPYVEPPKPVTPPARQEPPQPVRRTTTPVRTQQTQAPKEVQATTEAQAPKE